MDDGCGDVGDIGDITQVMAFTVRELENGPVEIVDFPISYVNVQQRVISHKTPSNPIKSPLNHHFPSFSDGFPMVFLRSSQVM